MGHHPHTPPTRPDEIIFQPKLKKIEKFEIIGRNFQDLEVADQTQPKQQKNLA